MVAMEIVKERAVLENRAIAILNAHAACKALPAIRL